MRLSQILRDIFVPNSDKGVYKRSLNEIEEEERRLNRCAVVLDGRTAQSIVEATEEAARFDGDV